MILHIVLFQFRAPWDWSAEQVQKAEQVTRNHPTQIDEIQGWFCGRNMTLRDVAADFAVLGLFNNTDELQSYLLHPDHQQGVRLWQALADWQVVDINLSGEDCHSAGRLSLLQMV
ncbi:Stress responsive A/B Barrel Domain protein [Vibrio aerogenes CECT 7868]|uniref:Stress responsive A/B Barrel Domain protein n=1 Tax=Vibrio aerogenes CECT 7868 TaxID=1216006 RepID=A0A1M5UWN6_9VIBR|nr:Dabb family protein [Vibrio aerogenes]SHH67411.1 Stress responsive A/B Barrel Domain protein [Vibrio aerogenes CECT 7868]